MFSSLRLKLFIIMCYGEKIKSIILLKKAFENVSDF